MLARISVKILYAIFQLSQLKEKYEFLRKCYASCMCVGAIGKCTDVESTVLKLLFIEVSFS